MNRPAAWAVIAVAAVGALAHPAAANADPLDGVRGSVNGARSQTTCPPLTYSGALENAAQAQARGLYDTHTIDPSHGYGYNGHGVMFFHTQDPTAQATADAVIAAQSTIHDCSFKDFGVGMYRWPNDDKSTVAIALGQPAAPPPPPAAPPAPVATPVPAASPRPAVPSAPAFPVTPAPAAHTVTGDVDLYDVPGGNGRKIGMLKQGDTVTLNGPCPLHTQDANNGWCRVTDTTQHVSGSVWGDFVSK